MVWVCPLQIFTLKPNPKVRVLRGRAFVRWFDHKSRALTNGISALIEKVWQSSLPLLPCQVRLHLEDSIYESGSRPLLDTDLIMWARWSWTFSLQNWEINFCSLYATQSAAFCYSSLNRLRHPLSSILPLSFLLPSFLPFSFFLSHFPPPNLYVPRFSLLMYKKLIWLGDQVGRWHLQDCQVTQLQGP